MTTPDRYIDSYVLSDITTFFIACQPWPVYILILSTLRRYLLSYETGLDIVLYKFESQVCDISVVLLY